MSVARRALFLSVSLAIACGGREVDVVDDGPPTLAASRCSPWFPVDVRHTALFEEVVDGVSPRQWERTFEGEISGVPDHFRVVQRELGAEGRVESVYTCDDAGVWLTERFSTDGELAKWETVLEPYLAVPRDIATPWETDAALLVTLTGVSSANGPEYVGGDTEIRYTLRHEPIAEGVVLATAIGDLDTVQVRTTQDGSPEESFRFHADGVGLVRIVEDLAMELVDLTVPEA